MQKKPSVFSLSAFLPCYRLVMFLDQNIFTILVNSNQLFMLVIFPSLLFSSLSFKNSTIYTVQCYTYMHLQWHYIIQTNTTPLLEYCAGMVKDILYSLSPEIVENERQRGREGKCWKKRSPRADDFPKESF